MGKSKKAKGKVDARTRAGASAYFRTIADRLRLRDWHIVISEVPADDNYSAQINAQTRRHRATVFLCHNWDSMSPEEQRQTTTHELLHCLIKPLDNTVDLAEDNIGKAAQNILWNTYQEAMEIAVDHLADIIAPFMPLPGEVEVTA